MIINQSVYHCTVGEAVISETSVRFRNGGRLTHTHEHHMHAYSISFEHIFAGGGGARTMEITAAPTSLLVGYVIALARIICLFFVES